MVRWSESLLAKLKSKFSIGNLLTIMTNAQNVTLVKNKEDADFVYDSNWVMNPSNIDMLLVD